MTTTESQITSGKAVSIDTAEFGLLLAKVELAATKIDHAQRDAPEYEAAFQRLIAHIEAWGQKQREEGEIDGMALMCETIKKSLCDEFGIVYVEGPEQTYLQVEQAIQEKHHGHIAQNHEQACKVTHALMAERDHFKAIAERQAADPATVVRWNMEIENGEVVEDPDPAGEYVRFEDVAALLSPAQQEPAEAVFEKATEAIECTNCKGHGCDSSEDNYGGDCPTCNG